MQWFRCVSARQASTSGTSGTSSCGRIARNGRASRSRRELRPGYLQGFFIPDSRTATTVFTSRGPRKVGFHHQHKRNAIRPLLYHHIIDYPWSSKSPKVFTDGDSKLCWTDLFVHGMHEIECTKLAVWTFIMMRTQSLSLTQVTNPWFGQALVSQRTSCQQRDQNFVIMWTNECFQNYYRGRDCTALINYK